LQAFATLGVGLLLSFSASWQIAVVTLATFPINAAANAIQLSVMMGQGTDKEGISGGAEANGLLSASIAAIRTVSAFSMQERIQLAYEKVSGRESHIR